MKCVAVFAGATIGTEIEVKQDLTDYHHTEL